jgi:alpha-L-rhamnosidase
VEAGADTFWEVYDPAQPLSSPYGDIHINSFCHAWSCTPSYFLRSGILAS